MTILPCPFCGFRAEVERGVGEYWVGCQWCRNGSKLHASPSDAIDDWNRRIPRPTVSPLAPRPIVEAPKDGTPILTDCGVVRWGTAGVPDAFWNGWTYCDARGLVFFHTDAPSPKYWIPLPDWKSSAPRSAPNPRVDRAGEAGSASNELLGADVQSEGK